MKKSAASELVSQWITQTGIIRQREKWHCGDMCWEIGKIEGHDQDRLFLYKRQVDGLDRRDDYRVIREEFSRLFGDYIVRDIGYRYEGDGEGFYCFWIAPPLEQLAQNEMTHFIHSFME